MYGEPANDLSALQHEWVTLQNQFDSYEKYALIIKLVAIILLSIGFALAQATLVSVLVVLVVWLQEGIWKTFQGRIYQRLLVVEKALSEGQGYKAMQFNSSWQDNRAGYTSLVAEYCRAALKPTVAYPYIALVICSIIF